MNPLLDIALILGTLLFLVVGTTAVAKIYTYAASLLSAFRPRILNPPTPHE